MFVITQEDIRRSGARSIPEALRLAPGLEVARIDANKWAIASRGFNGRFTNKLLVLIDGRSVYTPLFSGVYWNVQDVFLEDVDRIEVIRGPGATLWGANAVNGVINIITKPVDATQGALTTLEAGNELKGSGGFRFGGKAGDNTYYRAYTKYFKCNSSETAEGADAFDGWDTARAGFRIDRGAPSDANSFTLQGDAYNGEVRRNADRRQPDRSVRGHVPQRRRLQRRQPARPLEAHVLEIRDLAPGVFRSGEQRGGVSARRPPEHLRHRFPARRPHQREQRVDLGNRLPLDARQRGSRHVRDAQPRQADLGSVQHVRDRKSSRCSSSGCG